jgi:hypothetical protein
MAKRRRHKNKAIHAAVRYALGRGWTLIEARSHAWGRLRCPHRGRDGCLFSVWSTPRDPDEHARYIRRMVDRCPHQEGTG